ncbi:MAG TPA: serine/threonine-protein kinase, partial [Myxococcota bacterium]|nr:serine/threonine-protein kinase [Myxococcota bacterium]
MIAGERERGRIAQDWLARLLDLAPERRDAALAAADLDPALEARVRRLLDAADHPDPRLEPGTGGLPLAGGDTPGNALAGRRLGCWELEEEIGRGGMSVVYRAHRVGADFEQVAAVKLLGLAMLDAAGVRRFEQEQRILAALRHPHIAGLIDAGVAADGTPWLALALVDGQHIDAWCDARALGLAARVQLLAQVCDAVAHAHRNLVVHRDIKPGNILVTAAGVPVLLDFGIAKLLDTDTESTRTAARALTPGYAAPEQADGGLVSTATDVYALGAVLRRLCAPCEPLPRDLRNVIARATHPEQERRYRDAHALGEDLQRWLRREPVTATPDSLRYRLGLFIRRRRGVAIASTAALLLLVAGVAATLWQAQRASDQARRAEASRDFLVDLLLAADPERSGAEPSLDALVARGIQRVDAAFADSPALHAEIAMLLGHLAMVSGDHARAGELLDGAHQRSLLAGDAVLQGEVLYRLAVLANRRGEPRAAVDAFERAMAVPGLAPDAAAALRRRILPELSYAVENTGDLEAARALADEALALA